MSSQIIIRSLRILVVENHPDTLESLKWYLEDLGHQVFTSMTLRDARFLLRNCHCEMVLCDIGLPDGTGWELMEEVPPADFCRGHERFWPERGQRPEPRGWISRPPLETI